MSDFLTDFLAIIGVVLNGLPQGLLALTFGFASIPTAFAFLAGAAGNLLTGSVAPISFQAETITYAGTAGKNMEERLSMIFFGAVIMTCIGIFGFLSKIVNFIGPTITTGMMAGVGIMLAKVSMDMLKSEKVVSIISIATAVAIYFATNDLVLTITISVVISSIVGNILNKDMRNVEIPKEKIERRKLSFNSKILRGALGMVCLNIGSNIAFGQITGSMANTNVNIDHLSVISSLADMGSSLFGGAPVESIISATGSAPHPLAAGVIMMLIMAAILFLGLLPKIGKYVPSQSISGFLFVLGILVTVPGNAAAALAGSDSLVGGVTMGVTAISDPFFGMLAGIITRFAVGLF
ncbi:putative membrane protein [Clostridium argentinense CDC 2741]|uniref:Putative membrane protein n=1 Tax=Clostridium argentinense CDC 2741 TaxID=1418104 RepID=A0A0C1R884_9CLOT|nr:guanine permease [Clostridium argentinense]ARC86463.1 guanine permease [Clostridium argentinense]KIE46766.1 putative membrane protein [Clostridium argentinense CDC 2741]NFF37923.1 NCS2 family permease [Clostridium argentinense]NFP49845.1 NCS2 family permease [Clostridium argentinense]NFP71315.1 NCS2 family permease [Clostridium argentinense]